MARSGCSRAWSDGSSILGCAGPHLRPDPRGRASPLLRHTLPCSSLTAAALALPVAPASAAAPSTQDIVCAGQTLTIRTNNSNSGDNGGFSAAQIVSEGGGHLIPLSFTFSAYDVTTSTALFSDTQVKGNGHANQNQATTTCTKTFTGTLADLLQPGDTAPAGVALTDVVTATFTAVVVAKR